MKIAITTDHSGFVALKELASFLTSLGHECVNFGPTSFDADDDYPDFMFPAAHAVADGSCDVAIIMGGSGQGEAIAANRIKGVRAAVFYGPVVAKTAVDAEGTMSDDPYEIIKLSRQHNNANVLSLSARFLTMDQMKQASQLWLETPVTDVERHLRRIKKLDA
ncbi:MAG: ribose-5-phosphate isomerase ribose 5-phosphate isomerase [Candidatus Saccharibacteria bacterium]|nr:ribose-5-phosphate isomerase ribose 5-phosphate isomerase [Candidatus Saccharibacteria bacterium]